MKILSTNEMKSWEVATLSGTATEPQLMREAVDGCARLIRELPHLPILILCGKGNNGNDGLLLALQLLKDGGRKVVALLSDPVAERRVPPFEEAEKFAKTCPVWPDVSEIPRDGRWIVVDALLGLGAKGVPRGHAAEVLRWLKKNPGDIFLAIDSPSGLDADTGEIYEPFFPADSTYAIGSVKAGCLLDRAALAVGRILPVPITLAHDHPIQPLGEFYTLRETVAHLVKIPVDAHKHSRGRLGIVAGSPGMLGAATLCSLAAFRAGAGFVKLYQDASLLTSDIGVPEVVRRPFLPDGELPEDFGECHAHVVGPGIGRTEEVGERFVKTFLQSKRPTVLDADALYWLGKKRELLQKLQPWHVLTPHQGEMAGLLGHSFTERLDAAKEWTDQFPGVLVLKGPHTIIAERGKIVSRNSTGGPWLATAGTGDVLAGIISALLAQGYEGYEAARLGVFIHGLAADLFARERGWRGLRASDVAEGLGLAWRELAQAVI